MLSHRTAHARESTGSPHRPARRARSGAAIVLVLLFAATASVACGASGSSGSTGGSESVSLARLSEQQEDFAGHRVTTSGTVRRFGRGAGVHYVIEDAAHHRVAVEPAGLVEARVGRDVTVTGVFHFDETTGRRITAESVHPTP